MPERASYTISSATSRSDMDLSATAKIIIADDTVPMLIALRRVLVQLGYSNIIEAENGEQAHAALLANPDTALILSDWNMGPMDGLELLGAIRSVLRFSAVPFILISADAAAVRAKALEAGANRVLSKPCSADTLRQTIQTL